MSSKTKRSISSGSRTASEAIIQQMSPRKGSTAAEFSPDYSPIIRGLKRIGLLAGIFLVVLIVLTFFLR